MEYTLKDKIEVTKDFLEDLIKKNWQEVEAIQQQISCIDTSTKLGTEVSKVLQNVCTNYYVLIGCLESITENPDTALIDNTEAIVTDQEPALECDVITTGHTEPSFNNLQMASEGGDQNLDFEPFEYFVDFDEPSGEPISDKDLYGN